MMKRNRVLTIASLLLLLVGIAIYFKYFISNTAIDEKEYLYIKTGSSFENVIRTIDSAKLVKDISSFTKTAKQFNLENNIHPGKFEICPGMSNYKIARMLRANAQKPVKLVINKIRTKQQLASFISSKLEADSLSMIQYLNNNQELSQIGLDSNSIIGTFLPNTYEFYWNSDAKKIVEKINKYYQKFWSQDNLSKAKNLGLTPIQVMTIASIVEEETNHNPEKGNVASVYLNRLKKGMKLQADPTVKYAIGDFAIRRVLLKQLQTPSPYNTYYVNGLPPGPICTPSESSIKAVLNAPATDYLFFCASPDKVGTHNFATNDQEHAANAKKFQDWLNTRGIKK
jgi:UPF0755 protein